MMEYRILGKTGLRVSRMGFGGIPIQKIDREGTRVLMRKLLDAGVNYIDTAKGYTVSEAYLGYALDGIRENFILATKSMATDKAGMAADIEDSLKKLNTDYIDIYQVHNPSMEKLSTILAPGGALEALLEAKAAGKIRHLGLTCHSLEVFQKALDLPWVETIMFPFNIVETHGAGLIRLCQQKNIGFIDMKPLAGGALEDARLALRFICANDTVTVTIPGMADPREIEENAAAVSDLSPMTAEEVKEIDRIRRELGTQFCRRCNYCAPCSVGIAIPNVFLFEGYLSRYGLQDWAKDRYGAMAHTASECIGCGQCEPRCPYGLPIRDMMKRAAEKFGK